MNTVCWCIISMELEDKRISSVCKTLTVDFSARFNEN